MSKVITPFCIQELDGMKDVVFVSGSCGHDHTVLLDKENDVYGYGGNGSNQTGNIGGEKTKILPYKTTKKDIGAKELSIVRVICDDSTTIVVCEE